MIRIDVAGAAEPLEIVMLMFQAAKMSESNAKLQNKASITSLAIRNGFRARKFVGSVSVDAVRKEGMVSSKMRNVR
jgi:hypothetical protein